MSFDLGVWFPHKRLSADQAGDIYSCLCDGDTSGILPHPAIETFYAELTAKHPEIRLADKITTDYKFFAKDSVPAGTYEGQEADVATISVGAQWITSADQPEELIYGITKALWNDNTRKQLDAGHAKGKVILEENALNGLGLPLHPGAERFYKEAGLLK